MIYVGIDLRTNNMVNVALNDNAEVVRRAKLPTSGRALEDFFGKFSKPTQNVAIFNFWNFSTAQGKMT